MTDQSIQREVRRRLLAKASEDANALRVVGLAVTISATAKKRRFGGYIVERGLIEALQRAVLDAGFRAKE